MRVFPNIKSSTIDFGHKFNCITSIISHDRSDLYAMVSGFINTGWDLSKIVVTLKPLVVNKAVEIRKPSA